jgi:hypothetical protein
LPSAFLLRAVLRDKIDVMSADPIQITLRNGNMASAKLPPTRTASGIAASAAELVVGRRAEYSH